MFLFESGTKTVDEGVAVHVEGSREPSGTYSVPVREDQHWQDSELGENLENDNFRGGRKNVLSPLPKKGGKRAYPF